MEQLLYGKSMLKAFGEGSERRPALNNVSISIAPNEFVAVMGASGSGKSTLLYALSGMDCTDGGDVVFEGKSLSGLSDNALSDLRRKKMGFVFQQPTMLRNLTILDNILLPQMRDHYRDGKKLAEKALFFMEQAGIAELAQRDIAQVSGGQLQRAGICRALMNNPKIIFADEPTGALNKQSSLEVMEELTRINQEGTSIMLVTHDMKVASKCERILYIEDGDIRAEITLGKYQVTDDHHARERKINDWLIKLGW